MLALSIRVHVCQAKVPDHLRYPRHVLFLPNYTVLGRPSLGGVSIALKEAFG